MTRMDILIVDDERVIRESYSRLFRSEGYSVRSASSGRAALVEFRERLPGVVLLDVDMPVMDGFETCGHMRRMDDLVPIIFNTAYATEGFKERGLELGGDDYILKTDPESELLARVRRAVRRLETFLAHSARETRIAVGDATVDLAALTVTDSDGKVRLLSRTQADILRLLDSDRGRVWTSDDIIAAIRGEGFACEDGMVYVHMSRLRRQLGKAGRRLVSNRGAGYLLMPQESVL